MAKESKMPMLLDALAYPFLRFGWLLIIMACGTACLGLLSLHVVSGRLLFAFLVLVGVVMRCYYSIIESTVTGWGEEAWQGSGLQMEGLWGTMGATFGIALAAWLPAGLALWAIPAEAEYRDVVVAFLSALGCDYFCLAVLAMVTFGSFTETLPHRVVPAFLRAGPSFVLAGLGLVLVPTSFHYMLQTVALNGVALWLAAASIAAFFLMAHARLMGLLFLANRERIGW